MFPLHLSGFSGLPASAVELVRGAFKSGVVIDIVNVMAMNYGVPNMQGRSHADCTLIAFKNTHGQLKQIFGYDDEKISSMIGLCPMIGKNDDSSTFTLNDATIVSRFAKQNEIGMLSYWALQRDQPGTGNLGLYSGVNVGVGDFFKEFNKSLTVPFNIIKIRPSRKFKVKAKSVYLNGIILKDVLVPFKYLKVIKHNGEDKK